MAGGFFSQARAEEVVVIGDSHSCGDFGQRLVRNLSEKGKHKVTMYCAPGMSVQHFQNGFKPPRELNKCRTYSSENPKLVQCQGTGDLPSLAQILNRQPKVDRVIVALGTNNLGLNGLKSFAPFAKQIRDSGAKCDWIGPPVLGKTGAMCQGKGPNLEKLIAVIQKEVGSLCQFVDSRDSTTAETTPDCVHRFGEPARRWADGVFQSLLVTQRPVSSAAPTPASAPAQANSSSSAR